MVKANILAKALKNALLAENKISGSIELNCSNGVLNVIGNNGDITVVSKIPCEEEFDVAVDGQMLLQAIAPLGNQDVKLKAIKKGLSLSTKIMSMEFFRCSCVKLKEHTYDKDIYVPNLIKGLRETSHAIGSGTNFSAAQVIDGKRIITLDGKRISIRGKRCEVRDSKVLLSEQASKTIRSVFSDTDELDISVSQTRIKIEGENCFVEATLLGENFIDVDRLLANVHAHIIFKVMKCDLVDYINTSFIKEITLTFDKNGLLVSAPDMPQCGNYRVKIEGEYEIEPEEVEFARYDARYLKDAIKSIASEEIYLKYDGERSPLCISDNDKCDEWLMPLSTIKNN